MIRHTGPLMYANDIHLKERRRYKRVRRRQKLAVYLSDGNIEYLWTVDMSRGGLQAHTNHLVELGDRLRVSFAVFNPMDGRYVNVFAWVEVSHKIYDGEFHAFRIGLRFLEFRKNEDLFFQFIQEQELRQ